MPDLKQRQIITQVQLCINNSSSCNNKGDYFIADFVLAKISKNSLNQDVWDIIIADTKLSESTDFTTNQNNAMRVQSYVVKVNKSDTDINGSSINMPTGTKVQRITMKNGFIKIYSHGNGVYKDAKIF